MRRSIGAVLAAGLLCVLCSYVPSDAASAVPRLAAIEANDNTAPAGRLRDGVLHLDLVARRGLWYPDGPGTIGLPVEAFGQADGPPRIPGPLVHVASGTRIALTVRNALAHDLTVRGLTSPENAPTTAFVVRKGKMRSTSFVLSRPGVYGYYGSKGETLDARMGDDAELSGAIVVDAPKTKPLDHVFVLGLYSPITDGHGAPDFRYFLETINGRSFPATERLTYRRGDAVRWGVFNASAMTHPMHLHGFYFRAARPDAYQEVTHAFHPGDAEEIAWTADRAGTWMFHCHIGDHSAQHASLQAMRDGKADPGMTIESRYHLPGKSMGGMVVAVEVRPRPGDRPAVAATNERRLSLDVGETGAHDKRFHLDEFTYALGEDGKTTPHAGSMGPPIVLSQNEPVAIAVTNHLREGTSVHWHGIALADSYYDVGAGMGMALMGAARMPPAIAPGATFVAHFTPPDAGTFMYHAHLDDDWQIAAGLAGPLIVLPRGEKFDAATDHVEMISESWESPGGPIAIDGAVAPPPIHAVAGVPQRLRFSNLTLGGQDYVVSLAEGKRVERWTPLAKDGRDVPPHLRSPQVAVHALTIGETRDFRFVPQHPGTYTIAVYDESANGAVVGSQTLLVTAPASVSISAERER